MTTLASIRRKLDALERRPPPEPLAPLPDAELAMKLKAVYHAGRRPEATAKARRIAQRIGEIVTRCRARMTGADLI